MRPRLLATYVGRRLLRLRSYRAIALFVETHRIVFRVPEGR